MPHRRIPAGKGSNYGPQKNRVRFVEDNTRDTRVQAQDLDKKISDLLKAGYRTDSEQVRELLEQRSTVYNDSKVADITERLNDILDERIEKSISDKRLERIDLNREKASKFRDRKQKEGKSYLEDLAEERICEFGYADWEEGRVHVNKDGGILCRKLDFARELEVADIIQNSRHPDSVPDLLLVLIHLTRSLLAFAQKRDAVDRKQRIKQRWAVNKDYRPSKGTRNRKVDWKPEERITGGRSSNLPGRPAQ